MTAGLLAIEDWMLAGVALTAGVWLDVRFPISTLVGEELIATAVAPGGVPARFLNSELLLAKTDLAIFAMVFDNPDLKLGGLLPRDGGGVSELVASLLMEKSEASFALRIS